MLSNKVTPIEKYTSDSKSSVEGSHTMADIDNGVDGRDSPRDVENGVDAPVPKARVTMTKNGGTEVTLMNKNRQSTKLQLGELDGDLAELLAELDMDGDGSINSAELVRAMQIIKSEREGIVMWRKFAIIMGVILAVSLLINLSFTLYGMYYIVVSTKETKVKGGYLVGAKDDGEADAEDSERRQLKAYNDKKIRSVSETREEYDQMVKSRRNAVRVKPQGAAVANYGVEAMFPYVRGDGTVDDEAKAVYAMNVKKLSVDTFGSGAGVKRSHEVIKVESVWMFEHILNGETLHLNCDFAKRGAYCYYKGFTSAGENAAGGPVFFKLATRGTLRENAVIHNCMLDMDMTRMDPSTFEYMLTQPAAAEITGPSIANHNNNEYGIGNDWYSMESFMFTPNRCKVVSGTFKSICEQNSVDLMPPMVMAESYEVISKEEKLLAYEQNMVATRYAIKDEPSKPIRV